MANKVALKVVQYRVADSLDKLRLPSNPRAIINREKNAGKTLEDVLIRKPYVFFQFVLNSTGLGSLIVSTKLLLPP